MNGRAGDRGRAPTSSAALAGAFAAGMCLLAAGAHRAEWAPLKWAGLLLAVIAAAGALATAPAPLEMLGLRAVRRGWLAYGLPLLALAAAAAATCRAAQGRTLVAVGLTLTAVPAVAIGLAEELAYRGLVQGALARLGAAPAVVIACAAHTAYKVLLLACAAPGEPVSLGHLAGGTFVVGLLLGWTRLRTGNVLPACLFHAAFDLLAYGDLAALPWWSR